MQTPDLSPPVRAFVAIGLPIELARQIGLLKQLIQKNLAERSIRWVRPELIHLTLRFLGNVPGEQIQSLTAALRVSCAGIAPFHLSIEKLGAFPSLAKPTVLWLGLNGDLERLRQLEQQVLRETQKFGDHSEERAFHPHLTLGRVRNRGRGLRRISECLWKTVMPSFEEWRIEEVLLVQSRLSSEGSKYSNLAAIPLI